MQSIATNAATAATQSVSTGMNNPGGVGGALNAQKDLKESQTEAKFGDVLQNIQAKYGAKPEKQREIKKTLGKDDFLRIMITQMRHQDPTNPFKAEQMATEMAQFTSVEQLQNLNQNMQKMANQNQPLERLAMTNLIGKSVTIDRDRFAHVDGQNESLSYHLPKPASQVHMVVISEQGEVVLEKDLGAQKQGDSVYAWDGKKSNTLPAKSGNYIMRVEAKDENGNSIATDPMRKVQVVGISFEGGEPILLVGDNKRQDKVTMKNVVRIESSTPLAPGQSAPASESISGKQGPSFISFQKGVGSGNLDPSSANPEVAEALAKFNGDSSSPNAPAPAPKSAAPGQAQFQAPSSQGPVTARPSGDGAPPATMSFNPMAALQSALGGQSPVKAEGFPNGLSSQDQEESKNANIPKGGDGR